MKTLLFPSLILAALGFTGAGCTTHPETGALLPQSTTKFDQEMRESFVLMDKGVQYSVTCNGLQPVTLPDGRLQVAAAVRNRENRRLQVQINCEFKDLNGFALDSTPWETFILTENSIETKTFVSLNDKAKKYTIRVREAR